MQCFRCNSRDFDVVISSFNGSPYVECFNCRQGFVILHKLEMTPVELIGINTEDLNSSKTILLNCFQCRAHRFIDTNSTSQIQHTQYCNRCIEASKNDGSKTLPYGEKIEWENFLSHTGKTL